MRYAIALVFVLWACDGGDSTPKVDASTGTTIDAARPIDAARSIDAMPMPDAGNSMITATCTSLCDMIGVCVMEPTDPTCASECAADLADCTAQQVLELDACKTKMCGDIVNDPDNSPLVTCVMAVSCVNM